MIVAILTTLHTQKPTPHPTLIMHYQGLWARSKRGPTQLTARTGTPPQKWHLLKSRVIENAPKTSHMSTNKTTASGPSVVVVDEPCCWSQICDKIYVLYFAPVAVRTLVDIESSTLVDSAIGSSGMKTSGLLDEFKRSLTYWM